MVPRNWHHIKFRIKNLELRIKLNKYMDKINELLKLIEGFGKNKNFCAICCVIIAILCYFFVDNKEFTYQNIIFFGLGITFSLFWFFDYYQERKEIKDLYNSLTDNEKNILKDCIESKKTFLNYHKYIAFEINTFDDKRLNLEIIANLKNKKIINKEDSKKDFTNIEYFAHLNMDLIHKLETYLIKKDKSNKEKNVSTLISLLIFSLFLLITDICIFYINSCLQ